jgi:TrbL/VirB6 plasmid conjugal transfer protein
MEMINNTFGAFLAALQGLSSTLATYALPVLAFTAVIYWYWEGGWELAHGGGGLGDTLASGLRRIITIGILMFLVTHWAELCQAILDALLFWSTGDAAAAAELLRSPGLIWEAGQKSAKPILQYDTWLKGIASTFTFFTSPLDLLSALAILMAFLAMTLSHGMILIEINLMIAVAAVTLPWALVRPVAHVGDFLIGWASGCFTRALVSSALLAIAVPLFESLAPPLATAGVAWTDPMSGMPVPASGPAFMDIFGVLATALLFLLLALIIPGRAARLVGSSLALTGSDIMAGAATVHRFAMMAAGAMSGARRVVSPLLK